MPDYPEDWPHDVDYSRFEGQNLTRGWYQHFSNPVGDDGLTLYDRREKEHAEKVDKYYDELIQKEVDEMQLPGINVRQYPGEECIMEQIEKENLAKEREQKASAAIKDKEPQKKPVISKGPSTTASKKAAAMLSQPKLSSTAHARKPATNPTKPKFPSSIIASRKKTPPPSNPSSMRHTAAQTASRSTVGYSRGRVTSATIKKSVLPEKTTPAGSDETHDTTLAPALYIQKYGVPPVGSQMWIRCFNYGCFDEDDEEIVAMMKGVDVAKLLDDEYEDFQLPLPS